jgi:hypothetical protein
VSVIPGELDRDDIRMGLDPGSYRFPGAVGRTIIDQDQFKVLADSGLCTLAAASDQLRQSRLLVEARNDDRERKQVGLLLQGIQR